MIYIQIKKAKNTNQLVVECGDTYIAKKGELEALILNIYDKHQEQLNKAIAEKVPLLAKAMSQSGANRL